MSRTKTTVAAETVATELETVAAETVATEAETVVKKTTTKKTTATAEKAKTDEIYIGPTIVNVVKHSTVFKDGALTDKVNACIKEFPAMAKLFVSIDDMPAAIKELNQSQSALKTIYNQVAIKYAK